MTSITQALVLIVETIASVYLLFVILRFLLQLVRADFYNPLSQGIVKITNPVLMPLRKIIPGLFGIDLACVILAIVVQVITSEILSLIVLNTVTNPLPLLFWGIMGLIMYTLNIYLVALFVMVIASFVAPMSSHPALMLIRQLTQPLLTPIQRIIPPMGGLDFSVMAIILIIYVSKIFLNGMASSLGLQPMLVLGF